MCRAITQPCDLLTSSQGLAAPPRRAKLYLAGLAEFSIESSEDDEGYGLRLGVNILAEFGRGIFKSMLH